MYRLLLFHLVNTASFSILLSSGCLVLLYAYRVWIIIYLFIFKRLKCDTFAAWWVVGTTSIDGCWLGHSWWVERFCLAQSCEAASHILWQGAPVDTLAIVYYRQMCLDYLTIAFHVIVLSPTFLYHNHGKLLSISSRMQLISSLWCKWKHICRLTPSLGFLKSLVWSQTSLLLLSI